MMEGDPASFQTWKIAPSVKPGSTDWTPIHRQFWGPRLTSHTGRTRQTPQQRMHAIEGQLVAVAQTQRKSCNIELEEEKWCEAD
jgi:hypothetical protein